MSDQRYRSAFTLATFAVPATVSLIANQFNKLGEYIVKAGEVISIGYGAQSGMDNALGRIYGIMQDATPAEIPGTWRLSIYSPQDRPIKILWELRTEAVNTVATDRTKQTPLPIGIEDVTKDKKFVLEFKPDVAKTMDLTKSKLQFDVTQGVTA